MTTLTLKRGDTWTIVVTWPAQISLASCTARMQVRDTNGKLLLAATAVDIDEENLQTTATFPTGDTRLVRPTGADEYYETDVELTYSDGTVLSTDTMQVTVTRDVTR